MSENKESFNLIINFLRELNCCYRCIIRYLGVHISEKENAYTKPQEFLHELLSIQQNIDLHNNSLESVAKRLKPNICPVCLNCFDNDTIERLADGFKSIPVEDYDYNNFFFNVSFPKCLVIRAHSMLLHLKSKFPDFKFGTLYEQNGMKDEMILEQPHKIFRAAASQIFSKTLNKDYHPKSHLSFLISIGYDNDTLEIENMKEIISRKQSNKGRIIISRNNIPDFLKDTKDDVFKKYFLVPPEVPDHKVILDKINIVVDPVYLGGRYYKFKRNVGQTPWIIDGVSVSEHNVQDLIFDALSDVLGCTKSDMTFTASGREDVDVRMLGSGRPFYVKIDNPKQRHFSTEQLLKVEKQIIHSELAAVIKLQTIYASDLNRIKFGEEQKKKTYRALCKTTAPDIKAVVNIINEQKVLNISQRTVLRVLHRRTLMSRDKTIYHMKASEIPAHSNLFELELVTQAGTYVKEFVHGDFERTRPSISSLIGYPSDMVALDCIDVDLVWPEEDLETTK